MQWNKSCRLGKSFPCVWQLKKEEMFLFCLDRENLKGKCNYKQKEENVLITVKSKRVIRFSIKVKIFTP